MDMDPRRSILLHDYMLLIEPTDELPKNDLRPVLQGLFGEVGGVMATAKKYSREGAAYTGYRESVVDEFGDVLWYFTTLCGRLGTGLDHVFSRAATGKGFADVLAASDLVTGPISRISRAPALPTLDETLLGLGEAAASLLRIKESDQHVEKLLQAFALRYLEALQTTGVPFSQIARANSNKVRGRFLEPDFDTLPTFDEGFVEEEQLPEHFEIVITQRRSGQCYLQWRGVFVGDPLTDNILDPDGYRFHDVFHFAHAAILHWSPTFRALIQQKRKSDAQYDEAQDGGRAIVIEEGLTAWIFSRAKELDLFDGQDRVSFDMLKIVQQFVRGYEVEACPLKLWEHAILEGYKVFRKVREENGGVVVGNRKTRTIAYKSLTET